VPTIDFKGKTAIENHHYTVPHHRLEFDHKLSCLPKNEAPSLDGNLIIEGDNLLALKALLPTHAGRVKCVYIDPPYNTGNEGWIYNDNLTQPQFKEWIGREVGKEGEDACRHDKWCCMMYPRLSLLRELLRDDGAIFVSIGEDEIHHLRMLMNEIFGEDNFICTIIWRNSTGPKQSRFFSTSHDFILVYARDADRWERNLLPRTDEQIAGYQNPDDDPRGPWRSGGLDARNYYSRGKYAIKCPGGRVINGPPGGSYWRIPEEKLWELHADNRIWWGEDKNNVPRIKRFLSEVQEGIVPQTVWDYSDVGHTQEAKQEYLRILPDRDIFTTPKPVRLIRRIIEIATEPEDLILDSFAGSGTTAQAVLEHNREDAGERRFVLVQMPYETSEHRSSDSNICREITASRAERAVSGYSYERSNGKGQSRKATVEPLGGSFTYARLSEEPLFGAYKDFGDTLPSYEDIAAYVYYTETSREFPGSTTKKNPAWDKRAGRIGEFAGRSYYLLYEPNHKRDKGLDREFLAKTAAADPSNHLVVYCEKVWVHRDELRAFTRETGKRIRHMLVPFNLK